MPEILILGGTSEASALAEAVAKAGMAATLSYAGRVALPRDQPVPVRVGGFGGVEGLASYLAAKRITHLVDATHPFAARISRNAIAAAALAAIPYIALQRPAWQAGPGDNWTHLPDIEAAILALDRPKQRIFLAIGRQHIAGFARYPQHHYLLRLVDRPDQTLPLPGATVVIGRGPFELEGDTALLREHAIERVIAKNSGGSGAEAKLLAARQLGIAVILIDRPAIPDRPEVATIREVMAWLGHRALRGV